MHVSLSFARVHSSEAVAPRASSAMARAGVASTIPNKASFLLVEIGRGRRDRSLTPRSRMREPYTVSVGPLLGARRSRTSDAGAGLGPRKRKSFDQPIPRREENTQARAAILAMVGRGEISPTTCWTPALGSPPGPREQGERTRGARVVRGARGRARLEPRGAHRACRVPPAPTAGPRAL